MKIPIFHCGNNMKNAGFPGYNKMQAVQTPFYKLTPPVKDTVSFGAMKKTEFSGLNRAVIEKFKAPIEKFNTEKDFQRWCKKEVEEITEKNYGGRQEETVEQRKHMLKEWFNYVIKENDRYTDAVALLILSEITKDLKPDNDNLPPILNKGVLADCIDEIDKNTSKNPKYRFDFNKMYETKLRALYFKDDNITGNDTGWIIIPSKKNDPKNFESNVKKLKTLSHKNWCTKSFNAEPYLSEGDFHIYLENGKPKLGVRFVKNKIQEIQGELNNSKIPLSYFNEVKSHIDNNRLKLARNTKREVNDAKKLKEKVDKIKKDLSDAIKKNDVKTIFEYFGIEAREDKDGMLTISKYRQPDDDFTFHDLGIDENKLFEKITCIEGNVNFKDFQVTNLGSLQTIGGNVDFGYSKVTNLGKLQTIGKDAYFGYSKVTNLGSLQTIGGDVYFEYSKVTNLGNLQTIGGNAYFGYSKVTNLGNLQTIGGNADFFYTKLTNLGNLQTIGGNVDFGYSQVTNLGSLQTIGGGIDIACSKLAREDFKNIKCTI